MFFPLQDGSAPPPLFVRPRGRDDDDDDAVIVSLDGGGGGGGDVDSSLDSLGLGLGLEAVDGDGEEAKEGQELPGVDGEGGIIGRHWWSLEQIVFPPSSNSGGERSKRVRLDNLQMMPRRLEPLENQPSLPETEDHRHLKAMSAPPPPLPNTLGPSTTQQPSARLTLSAAVHRVRAEIQTEAAAAAERSQAKRGPRRRTAAMSLRLCREVWYAQVLKMVSNSNEKDLPEIQ